MCRFGLLLYIYNIQCLFFNAGHRDLHGKKFRVLLVSFLVGIFK
jgi:hypothetical protein